MRKVVLISMLSLFLITGCSFKEDPIIIEKNKYVYQKIFIPDNLLTNDKSIKVPEITTELNNIDLEKIEKYIFDLYTTLDMCEIRTNEIKNIVLEFNDKVKENGRDK